MKAIQLKAYGQPTENIGVVEINDSLKTTHSIW